MNERVLVIGAGMAGLFTALALGASGRQVDVLERDPPAPEGGADEAFESWARRGVGHLRHSHAFLARLRRVIADNHPTLLAELLDAGVQELNFFDGLTGEAKARYRSEPGDRELTVLTSRRTTLELVMRRHVEAMPSVRILSGVNVIGLLGETDTEGRFVCAGLKIEDADGQRDEPADIVVDSAGRLSQGFEWLEAAGVSFGEESEDAGILYYTRHWRLRPGQETPPKGGPPGAGDLGYIKYGVFPGDNGSFSITLAVPEIEQTLRQAIMHPEVFDGICARIPGAFAWTDPARSEPVSKVFGMGDLKSRWRETAPDGKPIALNLFFAGDGLVRTNPLYGRGCSFAAVETHLLRDVLNAHKRPAARAIAYRDAVTTELRPYYNDMLTQDRIAIRRAETMLRPDYQPKLGARMARSFALDAITPALRADPALLREFMRGFHMLEPADKWLKRPANLVKVLGTWAAPKAVKQAHYAPKLGPNRTEMFAELDLSATADAERLGFAAV